MQLQKTSNFGLILTAMLNKIAKVQASPTELLTVANISRLKHPDGSPQIYMGLIPPEPATPVPPTSVPPSAPTPVAPTSPDVTPPIPPEEQVPSGVFAAYYPPRRTPKVQSDPLKQKMEALGYMNRFGNEFSKLITKETFEKMKAEVESLGTEFNVPVNMAGFNKTQEIWSGNVQDLNVNDQLKNMANADQLDKMLSDYLDKFATSVDEAKKQKFMTDFLELSKRLWHYSFNNQMLILMQTMNTLPTKDEAGNVTDPGGPATDVAGKGRWEDLGRRIKKGATGISIFRPITVPKKDDAGKTVLNENGEPQVTVIPGKFHVVSVFDYRQTEPIPGAKKVYTTPTQDWWQSGNTTEDEKTNTLREALLEFVKLYNVPIYFEETGKAGGYTTKDMIVISKASTGHQQLGTIFHELAHQHLLFLSGEREKTAKTEEAREALKNNRKHAELDAETVASVVSTHFGFPFQKASANYVVLHGASSKDVMFRNKTIKDTAKWLIPGLTWVMQEMGLDVPVSQGDEGKIKRPEDISKKLEAAPIAAPAPEPASTVTVPPVGQPVLVPVAQAWVRRNCKFADLMAKNPPEETPQNTQSVGKADNPVEIKKQVELEQQLKRQQPQLEKPVTEQKALVRKINRDPRLTPIINTLGPEEIKAVNKIDQALIKDPIILPTMTNRVKMEHIKEYPDNIPTIPVPKTPGKTPTTKEVQEQLKIKKP